MKEYVQFIHISKPRVSTGAHQKIRSNNRLNKLLGKTGLVIDSKFENNEYIKEYIRIDFGGFESDPKNTDEMMWVSGIQEWVLRCWTRRVGEGELI